MYINISLKASDSEEIYHMCNSQPAQLDCRLESCRFHDNVCKNVSPAITLNKSGSWNCWSRTADEPDDEDESGHLHKTIHELKKTTAALRKDHASADAELNNCYHRIDCLNKEISELRAKTLILRNHITELDEVIAGQKLTISTHERGLESMKARNSLLKKGMDQLRAKPEKGRWVSAHMHEEILRGQEKALFEREALLHEQVDRLSSRNAKLMKTIEELQ